jgi:hypothetical protein
MRVIRFNTKIGQYFKTGIGNTCFKKITISLLVVAPILVILLFLLASGNTVRTDRAPAPENGTPANGFPADKQFVPQPVTKGQSLVYFKTDKVAVSGTPFSFSILAADADGDELTYSASGLPDGASFDPVSGTFSWTPRYDQAGDYTVHFQVSDGELTDSEDITITVIQPYPDWDINGDSDTNVLDMVLVGQHWGETGLTGWILEDTNEDGVINVLDMIIIGQHWTG